MNIQRNLSKISLPPPAVREERRDTQVTEVSQTPQELIQKIIEKEKYDGCALLTKTRGVALWYVCSKKEDSHKPTFYNYNKSRKTPKSKVMKVVSISSKTITFDDGSNETLWFSPFFWMGGKVQGTLTPESECNLEDKGTEDRPTYTLACKSQEVQTGIQLEKTHSK